MKAREMSGKCGCIHWITKNRLGDPKIGASVVSRTLRAHVAEETFPKMKALQAI
jgi:hypothetical protein